MSEDCHDSSNVKHVSPYICQICNGPIGIGELHRRAWNEDTKHLYVTHYFIQDCVWHKDPRNLSEQDNSFLREMGISPGN